MNLMGGQQWSPIFIDDLGGPASPSRYPLYSLRSCRFYRCRALPLALPFATTCRSSHIGYDLAPSTKILNRLTF